MTEKAARWRRKKRPAAFYATSEGKRPVCQTSSCHTSLATYEIHHKATSWGRRYNLSPYGVNQSLKMM